ncbi:MAG TPA: cell division protein ZapA [Holophaga sp.]|nr:cell division protein ZapA [Holophaga sp.]
MNGGSPAPLGQGPSERHVAVLGHCLRIQTQEPDDVLARAVALLEASFRDMEEAYRLRWGSPPAALDTTTWVLLGALNLAHRVARLEQEAAQHTQDLEQTLSKLLDDVPDDPAADAPLFRGER